MSAEKCRKTVYGGSFTGHPCGNAAKVQRDGKWYCGTHDPEKVKERMGFGWALPFTEANKRSCEMADEFIYCPRCGKSEMSDCDYEDEDGEDTGEVYCEGCGWEGTPDELVCRI